MHLLTSLSVHVYYFFCVKNKMTWDFQTLYPNQTLCNEVEYLFSPIFQFYSIIEWLRDNKVMHVLVYLFLYSIDMTPILICPFSLIRSVSLIYCVES